MGILDLFFGFKDTIFLKKGSSLEKDVELLKELKAKYPKNQEVSSQLFMAQKGLEGEKEIIYQLKKSNIGMFVLHDMNIKFDDLTAQIDFIVITAWAVYFIECKNLIGNITVNEKGDFIREYTYNGHKIKKGMPSPYRQVQAQREVYRKIWKKRKGKLQSFLYEKSFEDLHRILVVVANGENILNTKRAPKDIKYATIRADALIRKLEYDREHSDRDIWSTKKEMQDCAERFLLLYVNNKNSICERLIRDINENEKSQCDMEELKMRLINYRKQKSEEKKIPAYYVFNNEELEKILKERPTTLQEMKEKNILTDVKINLHGREIIEIVKSVTKNT